MNHRVRCFLLLGLALALPAIMGGGAPAWRQKNTNSGPFFRDAWIMGWSATGDKLLYREETFEDQKTEARAVWLDARSGKPLRTFLLQSEDDKPDDIADHEGVLASFMEKEGIVITPSSPIFSAGEQSGFLTPDGAWLIRSEMHFDPLPLKKTSQLLTVDLERVGINDAQRAPLAQMEIKSLDGEHPLTVDSIGAVTLVELNWSPNPKTIAVVLEERRAQHRVRGIFPLTLPKAVMDAPIVASAPSSSPASAATAAPAGTSLKEHTTPVGGEPFELTVESGSEKDSSDQRFTGQLTVYRACPSNPLAPAAAVVATVYDRTAQAFYEYPLSSALTFQDLALESAAGEFRIVYMGEALKTIPLPPTQKSQAGAFAVQISSSTQEKAAHDLITKLCAKKLPAYGVLHQDNQGSRYRVRVGRFKNAAQAKQFAVKSGLKKSYPKLIVTKF